MKKILILSDTHGNYEILQRVLNKETDADMIFHLGDNYEDLDDFGYLTGNAEIFKVPGIFHPGYLDKSIPGILKVDLLGWDFLLVHNVDDVLDRKLDADIVFYGHTHQWKIQKLNHAFFINPGHLKDLQHKNRPATYCILKFNENIAEIYIKDLNNREISREEISKSALEDK